jgi:adenylate cyclase, class 1
MTDARKQMSELQQVLTKINQIANSYAPEKYALDVRILLRGFHEQLAAMPERHDDWRRIRSEVALSLSAVARRTQDLQLLITVTEQLFTLPPEGALYTFSLFSGETLQEPVQTALLESFSPLNQLLMVNLGLLTPAGMSAPFTHWLNGQLPLLSQRLSRHGASFTDLVSAQEMDLAPPLRTALNRSKLVTGLRAQIDRTWGTGSLARFLGLIRLLRLPSCLEYLSPALHTASEQRARELYAALRDTPGPYDARLLSELPHLVREAGPGIRPHALQALIALDPSGGLNAMRSIYEREPAAAPMLMCMLPLLDAKGFRSMFEAVPRNSRDEFCRALLSILLQVDPFGCAALLDAPCFRSEPDLLQLTELLRPVLEEHSALALSRFRAEHPVSDPGPSRAPARSTVGELREGAFLLDFDLTLQEFAGCRYTECEFENVRAPESRWADSVFSRCVFRGCSFEASSFTRTIFEGCSFMDCRLDHALFRDGVIRGGRMVRCLLNGAVIERSTIEDVLVSGCGFHRATLDGVRFLFAAVSDSDLGETVLADVVIRGSDLRSCTFASALVVGGDLRGMRAGSCSFQGVAIQQALVTEPALLQRTIRCFREEVLRVCLDPEHVVPTPVAGVSGHQALRFVRHWFDARSMRFRGERFQANNGRRMQLARERMSELQRDFFDLLPLFLTTVTPWGGPEQKFSWTIAAYDPSPEELSRARQMSGVPPAPTPGSPLLIQGVYAIGSIGSLAQAEGSDLDLWICADLSTWPEGAAQTFRDRLSGISLWAGERFAANPRFVLQDVPRVQGDEIECVEGSSTAQGVTLKEEFYRTGLKIAGLPPLWWMVPPGSSSGEYARVLESGLMLGVEFTDFGYLDPIPCKEFFGASLRQIVRSSRSPSKAILGLGLLESYSRRPERPLLCELLKEGILSGTENPLHVDPSALLFKEVWNSSCPGGDKEGLAVIRFSFLMQTGLDPAGLGELFGKELKGLSCRQDLLDSEPGVSVPSEDLDFPGLLRVERNVNRFMVSAYLRVQKSLVHQSMVDIDASDLSRLGRTIFTVFAPRADKIERLHSVLTRRGMFEEFSFSSSQTVAGTREWIVRGRRIDPVTNRSSLSELSKSADLVRQILWLVANRLYHPEIQVRTDFSVSPATRDDLARLLSLFSTALDPDTVFATRSDEGLEPERVVHSVLVLNMTVPRATEQVIEASICYSTSWGELFCRSFPVGSTTTPIVPIRFVSLHLDKAIDPDCSVSVFVPSGGACIRHLGA